MWCLDQTSLFQMHMFWKETFTYLLGKGAKLLPIQRSANQNRPCRKWGSDDECKTTKMIVGSLNFGSNGPAPHFMYKL
ncbi:MAG TPA: hypothetical protein VFI70_05665 [Nitrososphaeraceae archaeon]|nr:hypothetical protein [Nitrososphaeraceae archaeon]